MNLVPFRQDLVPAYLTADDENAMRPSYESIADHAHCGRTTVYAAINALERAGILSWVNRIARIFWPDAPAFAHLAM